MKEPNQQALWMVRSKTENPVLTGPKQRMPTQSDTFETDKKHYAPRHYTKTIQQIFPPKRADATMHLPLRAWKRGRRNGVSLWIRPRLRLRRNREKENQRKRKSTGCQNQRFVNHAKTHGHFALPDQKWCCSWRGPLEGLWKTPETHCKLKLIFNRVLKPKATPMELAETRFDPPKQLPEALYKQR